MVINAAFHFLEITGYKVLLHWSNSNIIVTLFELHNLEIKYYKNIIPLYSIFSSFSIFYFTMSGYFRVFSFCYIVFKTYTQNTGTIKIIVFISTLVVPEIILFLRLQVSNVKN